MKPNVLVIMCDQLRYDCLTNPYVRTPNMDRVRQRGVFFNNAYSQTPVCIPARHSFISGQDAFNIGLEENSSETPDIKYPLARLVRDRGYYTCAVGKMHFVPAREHFGFDKMYLSEEIPKYIEDDEYLQYLRDNGFSHIIEPHGKRSDMYYVPQDSALPAEYHTTAWTARKTVEVIEKNLKRNFFLFSSFIKPHPPFDPCEPYNKMYDPNTVPVPVRHPDEEAFDRAITFQNGYKVNGIDNINDEDIKKIRAYYYGSVSQVDSALGEILDCLKRNNLYDNTLIIFTADHGEMLGDHGGFGKRTYYEQSAKIPFIISYPSVFKKGTETDEIVILPDLYATILSTVGADIPDNCTGLDLTPLCKGGGNIQRSRIICQYGRGIEFKAMVRWDKYKYIYYANGAKEVLYDLENDPMESKPLINTKVFAEQKNTLIEYFKKYNYDKALDGDKLINYDYEKAPTTGYINQYPKWQERL